MANPFGKDFLSNLGRELDRQSVHGSDRGKERPAKQQPKPQRLLRGEPGSPERMAHVIEIGNQIDPSLISELRWEGVGVALQNALHAIRRDENMSSSTGTNPTTRLRPSRSSRRQRN